jgi:hypothetical protein
MTAFDLCIYSLGAFAIIFSVLMHWPKVSDNDTRKASPAHRPKE